MKAKNRVMGTAISSTMSGRPRMRSPLSANMTISVNSRPRIETPLRTGLRSSIAASPRRRTTRKRVATPAASGRPRYSTTLSNTTMASNETSPMSSRLYTGMSSIWMTELSATNTRAIGVLPLARYVKMMTIAMHGARPYRIRPVRSSGSATKMLARPSITNGAMR